ncbi:MAG: hypothetical protein QM597_06775 [Aeromicrobium sp.]|uniref:hypothetical protein n=1 Tax=Aeromicrobium sp. TaxID=1871063 RepID=UPI0039E5301E
MPSATLRVKGGRELRRTLKQAGDDLGDLKQAHAAAAGIVAPVARANAPVGATGRLAASVRPGASKTESMIRAGKKSVPYAGVHEFGWPDRNIAAQPFIIPAAHDTEPRWVTLFEIALNRILNRIQGA